MSDPYDKLDVQTPEQISLEFSLAGLGSRALALLYDSMIQLVMMLVLFGVLAYYGKSLRFYWLAASNWAIAAETFLAFCLYWGYFALFEILWSGQTPGKRQAQIRVISVSGRPITVFEGVARNFMRAMDSLFFYGVAVAASAIDKQNRRLGDMVAGTVVIHDTQKSRHGLPYGAGSRTAAAPHAVQSLAPAEFHLIETFLARRVDLPAPVRHERAAMIAERIAARLNIAPEMRPPDEEFLEDVARGYRDGAHYR